MNVGDDVERRVAGLSAEFTETAHRVRALGDVLQAWTGVLREVLQTRS